MKRPLLLLCLSLGWLAAATASGEDLKDIYQMARGSDPGLRQAEANRLAVREAKPQAVGALLPQITGAAGYTWDNPTSSSSGPQPGFGSLTSNSDRYTRTFGWSAQLRQSLFHWDQFVRWKQADKTAVQADLDYRVAELDLFLRVSTAYFNVLGAQDTLAASQATREAIGRQLEQSNKRFEVGLIAITDVQEAQAGYDQAVAAEILAKRVLANSKEALRAITGQYPGELAQPTAELALASPVPADENQWVETALQQNFSLQSAQIGAEIARDNIGIARGGHIPTIDLVGNYTDNDANGSVHGSSVVGGTTIPTDGPTFSRLKDPNVSVQMAIPIFSGGVTQSKVRQAVYLHRAAKEKLESTARETQRQAHDSYQGVISDISRVKSLQQALKSAQTALQATEAGFEVGTRTTVDVLAGRQTLFIAQTNYAQSRYDYILDVLRLKQAAGTLEDPDLVEVNSWLK